jgi:hypothetical protein
MTYAMTGRLGFAVQAVPGTRIVPDATNTTGFELPGKMDYGPRLDSQLAHAETGSLGTATFALDGSGFFTRLLIDYELTDVFHLGRHLQKVSLIDDPLVSIHTRDYGDIWTIYMSEEGRTSVKPVTFEDCRQTVYELVVTKDVGPVKIHEEYLLGKRKDMTGDGGGDAGAQITSNFPDLRTVNEPTTPFNLNSSSTLTWGGNDMLSSIAAFSVRAFRNIKDIHYNRSTDAEWSRPGLGRMHVHGSFMLHPDSANDQGIIDDYWDKTKSTIPLTLTKTVAAVTTQYEFVIGTGDKVLLTNLSKVQPVQRGPFFIKAEYKAETLQCQVNPDLVDYTAILRV